MPEGGCQKMCVGRCVPLIVLVVEYNHAVACQRLWVRRYAPGDVCQSQTPVTASLWSNVVARQKMWKCVRDGVLCQKKAICESWETIDGKVVELEMFVSGSRAAERMIECEMIRVVVAKLVLPVPLVKCQYWTRECAFWTIVVMPGYLVPVFACVRQDCEGRDSADIGANRWVSMVGSQFQQWN